MFGKVAVMKYNFVNIAVYGEKHVFIKSLKVVDISHGIFNVWGACRMI